MKPIDWQQLYFLLDHGGAVIAYQEQEQPWAGALAFSSEEAAGKFLRVSHVEAAEIVTLDTSDRANMSTLITSLKRRPIRYLLLDLDYQTGTCRQIDFDGDELGPIRERQFVNRREKRQAE